MQPFPFPFNLLIVEVMLVLHKAWYDEVFLYMEFLSVWFRCFALRMLQVRGHAAEPYLLFKALCLVPSTALLYPSTFQVISLSLSSVRTFILTLIFVTNFSLFILLLWSCHLCRYVAFFTPFLMLTLHLPLHFYSYHFLILFFLFLLSEHWFPQLISKCDPFVSGDRRMQFKHFLHKHII